jgi:hypothetical protein
MNIRRSKLITQRNGSTFKIPNVESMDLRNGGLILQSTANALFLPKNWNIRKLLNMQLSNIKEPIQNISRL